MVRGPRPASDEQAISRKRAEIRALLAALDAFLAQCRAAPPADTQPPTVEPS
jgi:hypothetical protein